VDPCSMTPLEARRPSSDSSYCISSATKPMFGEMPFLRSAT
jgi:hypothetical protein